VRVPPLTSTDQPYPNVLQSLGLAVGAVALIIFVNAILFAAWSLITPENRPDQGWLSIASVTLSFAIILVCLVFFTKQPLTTLCGLRPFPLMVIIPTLLLVSGMMILFSEMDNLLREQWPNLAFVPAKKPPEALISVPNKWLSLVAALGLVSGMELLIRGVIMRGLRGWESDRQAILKTAAIYMLVQMLFSTSLYIVPMAFLNGLVLSWLVVRVGSVWLALLAQLWFAGIPMILVYTTELNIPGFINLSEDVVAIQHQPGWLNLIGLILVFAGGWWLHTLYPPLLPEPNATAPEDDGDDDDF
jgi:membrane protease YdiL (CAAX protease family)